jgi:hypothetical protein
MRNNIIVRHEQSPPGAVANDGLLLNVKVIGLA